MIYKKLYLLIPVILIILTGCVVGDYDFQLIDDYYVFSCSADSVKIIQGDSTGGEIIIPEKVVEVAYDKQYIIAKQYGMKSEYQDDPERTTKIPDETKVYYWIIDTNEDIVFVPYEEVSKFELQKAKLGISGLKLKSVDSKEYKKNFD